jgi:hypothetical protein
VPGELLRERRPDNLYPSHGLLGKSPIHMRIYDIAIDTAYLMPVSAIVA